MEYIVKVGGIVVGERFYTKEEVKEIEKNKEIILVKRVDR